ncbi:hypothetical protein ACQP1G_40360 [Nocardia sp. CA-107356]|uniref:hypothetical protein n=1 Tax=Nocardia sp. CA-107356 TaxID=3239972 RepID=UPI003D8FC7D0
MWGVPVVPDRFDDKNSGQRRPAVSDGMPESKVRRRAEGGLMQVALPDYHELVAAVFSYEFVDGGIDTDALRRIHAGDVTEWITALDRSGMFGKTAIATLSDQWHRDPRMLLAALLEDVDDVTRRRCLVAWSALDRRSPLTQIG